MKKLINILSLLGIIVAPTLIGLLYSFETRTPQIKAEAMQEIVSKDFPLNQPRFIDFQVDDESLERLTERQRNNQLRDWLLFTIAFSHGLSTSESNQNFEQLPAFRYSQGKLLSELQYGETRSLHIGQGQVVALLPKNSSQQERKDNLAQIADQHRQDLGKIPTSLVVFEYEINPELQFAIVTRREVLDTQQLFTDSQYGYHEAQINSQDDLSNFINHIDYLTFAQVEDSSLRLGGRKIGSRQYPKITLEDVAALWQSEQKIQEPGSSFSLEPSYDYRALEDTLAKAEPSLLSLTSGIVTAITQDDIQQAKDGLAQNNEIPYLVLANKLAESINPTVAEQGKTALAQALRYRFQVARYGKNLQGTEAGMLLFYTDLLAKLWAIDYLSNTPQRDTTDFPPPKPVTFASTDAQPIKALSNVRIGFGARENGFQAVKGNKSLLLEPNATQIHAVAYNPLQPSESKTTTAEADGFLHWWSDRYEEILVRNEPQYEQLDEIIKWSFLISWLNETNQGEVLNFLNTVPVSRNHWFPDWVRTNSNSLKFPIWEQVKFYERGYKDSITEAMPTLVSKPSHDKGEAKFLSGEILLAKRGRFGGGSKSRPISPDFSQPPLNPDGTVPDAASPKTSPDTASRKTSPDTAPRKTSPDTAPRKTSPDTAPRKTSSRAQEKVKFRSLDSKVATPKFTNKPFRTVSGFRIKSTVDRTHLGSVNVARTENGFTVGWRSRNILLKQSPAKDSTQASAQVESTELADDLDNRRYDEIAQKLLREPLILEKHYNPKLKQIQKLLSAKRYIEAAHYIDQSIHLYGQQPDLIVFKAVVELQQERINVERIMPGQLRVGKEQSRKIFLDEVNELIANPEKKVKFRRSKTDKAFFYVQDTPGLNNIDWQLGIEQSISLISTRARVYKLLPGEIGTIKLSLSGFGDIITAAQNTSTLNSDGNSGDECNNSQYNQYECNNSQSIQDDSQKRIQGDSQKQIYIVIEPK